MTDGSPTARGWGPGWPTPRLKDMSWVTVRGVTIPQGVHKALAPLVGYLLEETLRRGYELVPGWCWGYACRPIRGSNRASNHSWGLAVDLNAPTNPMKSPLTTDMPRWMVQLWKNHGFAWGGDYTGRKDAMHFEFMGTPADALRLTPKHGATVRPAGTGPIRIEEARVDRIEGEDRIAWRSGKGSRATNREGHMFCWNTPDYGAYNRLPSHLRQGTRHIIGGGDSNENAPDGYYQLGDDGTVFVFPLQRIKGYDGP
jgi:hypothetical protein